MELTLFTDPACPFAFSAEPPLRLQTAFRRSVSTLATTLHAAADLPAAGGENFTVFGNSVRVSVETAIDVAPPSASASIIAATCESFELRSARMETSFPETYSLLAAISLASFCFPSGFSSIT